MRKLLLIGFIALCSACSLAPVHNSVITLDSHIDIPNDLGLGDADFSQDGPMQVDLPKMRAGGLDAGFFIVYVGQGAVSPQGYRDAYTAAQDKFAAIERMLATNTQTRLVRSPTELRAAVGEGKLAVAIGVENAYPLGANLEHLNEFYERGARYISLTHFGHNHFADSSVAKGEQAGVTEPHNEGISERGRALIELMNTLGIMVDVSHAAQSTTLQAAALSKTPLIASHSGVRALSDHPRNLSDEEIKAIAAGGGVIQLVAFDHYMRPVSAAEKSAVAAIKAELGFDRPDSYKTASQTDIQTLRQGLQALDAQWPRASIKTLVDHIDYVVNLVGIEHAGISSDFGGGGGVEGWDSIEYTPRVTAELERRGYSRSDIEKIWSGNLLRVWQEAENFSQQ